MTRNRSLPTTEKRNRRSENVDELSTREIVGLINDEDMLVAPAVAKEGENIAAAVDMIVERLKKGGLEKGPLSKMHMLGLGKWMIKKRMAKAKVVSLDKLMSDFKELGGHVIACEMTMEIMGIEDKDLREDLIDEYGAVGTYIQRARESSMNLFI